MYVCMYIYIYVYIYIYIYIYIYAKGSGISAPGPDKCWIYYGLTHNYMYLDLGFETLKLNFCELKS